jgi:thiamine-phosphate pyrophosphorylase
VSRVSSLGSEPILCYVTDRRSLPDGHPAGAFESLLRKIEGAAAAGIDWIQIREKDLSGGDCASLTSKALGCAAKASPSGRIPTRILVNDRLDVALSERAGGVHLSERGLLIADTRRLADSHSPGKGFLIGVSCHSLGDARLAESGGADYIFFGPLFATPSKAAYGAPQGLERLAEVCRDISLPVLAIGGVTEENAVSCLAAGASGIAAIRLFQDARGIASLVTRLRTQKV